MMFTQPLVNITLCKSLLYLSSFNYRSYCQGCVWHDVKKGGHCVLAVCPHMQAPLLP